MPTETSGDTTDADLAFTPGIILNRLKDTQTGVQSNEPIIVDELNRADIDKAFGQLFTLLSGQSVQLPSRETTAKSNSSPPIILTVCPSHISTSSLPPGGSSPP